MTRKHPLTDTHTHKRWIKTIIFLQRKFKKKIQKNKKKIHTDTYTHNNKNQEKGRLCYLVIYILYWCGREMKNGLLLQIRNEWNINTHIHTFKVKIKLIKKKMKVGFISANPEKI